MLYVRSVVKRHKYPNRHNADDDYDDDYDNDNTYVKNMASIARAACA